MAVSSQINGENAFYLLPSQSQVASGLHVIGTQQLELHGHKINSYTFHCDVFVTALTPIGTAKTKYGIGEAVYENGSITSSFLHFYFPSNLNSTATLFLS